MRRLPATAVLVLVLLGLPAGGRAALQPSPDDATLVLLVVTPEGRPGALGTAFFIDPDGTALTNSHVVYRVRENPARYRLLAVVGRQFYGATLVCAAHLSYDPEKDNPEIGRDVAQIRLTRSGFGFTSYRLGDQERTAHLTALPRFPALVLGDDPSRGEPVRIVGYGLVEERVQETPGARWTATGIVDAVGTAADGTRVFRVQSTNRPRLGNSGSPVLDSRGRVAGMWTWNEEDNLAYGLAIASSALKQPCTGARRPVRLTGSN
jgi:S1-C subfamily serine protease